MPELDPDLRALQEVRDLVERASRAQAVAATWDQDTVDAVCRSVAEAGARHAHDLAKLAVEETGIGRVPYKILKNLFGSEGTWKSIESLRTVGVVRRDERAGVLEVAAPIGVIAGIIPTTNPTSTVLNNALISLKGRNAIVFSPHPRAKRCIAETVEIVRRAIERAGGPADLVATLQIPTIESTGALMKHKKTALILSTGGSGLVRAAYSSGKPAYGVGPGNVPVYVDRSADVEEAARWITDSQSFDNATLCCSEQALVLDRSIADTMLAAMQKRGAHLCSEEETRLLESYCVRDGMMNADVVGQDPWKVADGAGFRVPRSTTVLLAHQGGVGRDFPLSGEILCPLLSVHVVDGWEQGCEVSLRILRRGGLGHTIGLWARDERVLDAWFLEKPASRIIANGPTSQGAVGYSSGLMPAFSLGCGPAAGNITSDNISAGHMISIKRVGFTRSDWESDYRRDLERVAQWTGERTPRGSAFCPGPGQRGAAAPAGSAARSASADTSEVTSSWSGNPPSTPQTTPSSTPPSGAPRFTAPTSTRPAPARDVRPAKAVQRAHPARAASPRPPREADRGPHVGSSLSLPEIQGILSQAGAGCPLGPCQGCPHHDATSGACKA